MLESDPSAEEEGEAVREVQEAELPEGGVTGVTGGFHEFVTEICVLQLGAVIFPLIVQLAAKFPIAPYVQVPFAALIV